MLTSGVSRTSAIQRTLLPVMLEWFADAPDPDAGLFGFRRISESLGTTPWYLKMLRDEGEVAQRLAVVLGTSRYATDLLEREPAGRADAGGVGGAAVRRGAHHRDARHRRAARRARGRGAGGARRTPPELFRIACGELFEEIDVAEVGKGLSRLTDATLEATLGVAMEAVRRQRSLDAAPTRMAVVAMGRYGGFELSYGSDADVMFVHEPVPGVEAQVAASYAQAVVGELRRLLSMPATDPPLEVDADLRPEGKQGPLVRTVESYAAYYAKWSHVWEFQALLRADAVVGDEGVRARFTALIDPLRFPEDGISEDDIVEVRRIKARVDDERLPRGADPHTHLKLGRGGLADVEWTVQLLQMRHAGRCRGLRTPQTLEALEAAVEAELIVDREDADDPRRVVAAGEPGAQRRHPGPRQARRAAAARRPRAGRGGRGARLRARHVRPHAQRLPADHPAGARGRREGLLGVSAPPLRPSGGGEVGASGTARSGRPSTEGHITSLRHQ